MNNKRREGRAKSNRESIKKKIRGRDRGEIEIKGKERIR
jgi:hypothetical protein